ncbi:hypothetical protein ACFQYP_39080 [Nonomuraea antimicrobica]
MGDISRFAALLTMAELGLADHLADGPLDTAELAGRAGAHAPRCAGSCVSWPPWAWSRSPGPTRTT